jgi:hypothetical protein
MLAQICNWKKKKINILKHLKKTVINSIPGHSLSVTLKTDPFIAWLLIKHKKQDIV